MSKSKIVAIMALIAFAMGILLVGNALAGEYFKLRAVWYTTKMDTINVGDEKDHMIGLGEQKGIFTNMQGQTFGEGFLGYCQWACDATPKGIACDGYLTMTDKDGAKIYMKWARTPTGPHPWTFYKGTGKFEGVRGKGTWSPIDTAEPMQMYADVEGEVELPR